MSGLGPIERCAGKRDIDEIIVLTKFCLNFSFLGRKRIEELDTWLERAYQADGNHTTLDALYDQSAQDYDQKIWTSGSPYIAIRAGFAGKSISNFDARILDA